MIFYSSFEAAMSAKEKEAWISSKEVVTKFLSYVKAPNYEFIVANMIDKL